MQASKIVGGLIGLFGIGAVAYGVKKTFFTEDNEETDPCDGCEYIDTECDSDAMNPCDGCINQEVVDDPITDGPKEIL